MSRVRGMAIVFGLLSSLPVAAKEPPAPLPRAIDRILDRPAFGSAFWGIEVRSLDTGKVLYARNAGKGVEPASTLKLVTTAAALEILGPDATLRTSLETAAPLDAQGALHGDVFLVGRGDPNLSGRFSDGRITAPFEALADALIAAGVRRIEGRLVGHEGLFSGERRAEDWNWSDLVWWYGAEVSALSFNDNCADLRVAPGAHAGDAVTLDRNPVSAYYDVVSTATTSAAGTKEELKLVRELGSNHVRVSGTYPLGAAPVELNVALEDPALYAVTVFAEVLAARGITLNGPVATSSEPLPAGTRVLAARDSLPLAELIQPVNKQSQNLHAEMLLRMLGVHAKGDGSLAAGLAARDEFLKGLGLGGDAWALEDGSGLARSNLLTPHGLVSLLAAMDKRPLARVYRDSLPVAGVDGSLKNRMKGTAAQGRILAKTGGIRHVSGLAGYATTRSGARLAFAIHLNHSTAPLGEAMAAIDAICQALVSR